jgi:hypothetical protein
MVFTKLFETGNPFSFLLHAFWLTARAPIGIE